MTLSTPRLAASPEWIGTTMVLISVFGFAVSGPGAKMAYDGGAEPMTVVAIRYATNVVGVGLLLLLFRSKTRLPARVRLGGLAIGALLATEAYLFLEGLKTVPVSLAVPVFFTFPLQVSASTRSTAPSSATCSGKVKNTGTARLTGTVFSPSRNR